MARLGNARPIQPHQELFRDDFEVTAVPWSTLIGALVRSNTTAHSGSWSLRATLASFGGVGFAILQRPFTPKPGHSPDVELWMKGPVQYQVSPTDMSTPSSVADWAAIHVHELTGSMLTVTLLGVIGAFVYIDDVVVYHRDGRPPEGGGDSDNLHIVNGYSEEYTNEYERGYGGLTGEAGRSRLAGPQLGTARRLIRG